MSIGGPSHADNLTSSLARATGRSVGGLSPLATCVMGETGPVPGARPDAMSSGYRREEGEITLVESTPSSGPNVGTELGEGALWLLQASKNLSISLLEAKSVVTHRPLRSVLSSPVFACMACSLFW